jgi:hypothetical protein
MTHGLLAFLDPEVRARYEAQLSEEEKRREYAAERLSALYFCTRESARSWLDMNDREAIEQAQRIMTPTLKCRARITDELA